MSEYKLPDGTYLCPYCNKICSQSIILSEHLRLHGGETPYCLYLICANVVVNIFFREKKGREKVYGRVQITGWNLYMSIL